MRRRVDTPLSTLDKEGGPRPQVDCYHLLELLQYHFHLGEEFFPFPLSPISSSHPRHSRTSPALRSQGAEERPNRECLARGHALGPLAAIFSFPLPHSRTVARRGQVGLATGQRRNWAMRREGQPPVSSLLTSYYLTRNQSRVPVLQDQRTLVRRSQQQ